LISAGRAGADRLCQTVVDAIRCLQNRCSPWQDHGGLGSTKKTSKKGEVAVRAQRKKSAAILGAAVGLLLGMGTAQANDSILKAQADPNNWPSYGRTYENTRFSPLKQITTKNVGKLKLAYAFSLASLRSNESTPLVIGDTLYVTSSWGPKYVFALDAATGTTKWTYEPDIPDDVLQYGCCDVDNRGVTYADGKIFVGRLDGNLTALDAKTGNELWTAKVVDYTQGSVITSPPLVVRDKVITGYGGGEYGARGSLQAYDINTGKLIWKTWTVPDPKSPGGDSWKGDSYAHGGGAAWLVGSYDVKTDTVYWGTSNPSPWATQVRSTGNSNYGKLSNLYTSSTLALDPNTGAIKWAVQSTPEDAWDFDGVNELVLADIKIDGKTVPVYLKADRNGFFYVVNRETGKLISAKPFVAVNWAKSIDLATTRPVEDPAKRPGPNHPATDICPNLVGGKNWQPISFDPQTGLAYIPANNMCQDMSEGDVNYRKGVFYLGKEFQTKPGPGGFLGDIEAYDPVKQKIVWEIHQDLPFNGGLLTTAGGLAFYGDMHGYLHAVDARSGKNLWSMELGSGIGQSAISFAEKGKQYIAIVVGRSASMPAFMGDIGTKIVAATPEGGMLYVFSE
jgi:alcohol dehydrogenase (cytochrome c)